jgi:hypothetical protein
MQKGVNRNSFEKQKEKKKRDENCCYRRSKSKGAYQAPKLARRNEPVKKTAKTKCPYEQIKRAAVKDNDNGGEKR